MVVTEILFQILNKIIAALRNFAINDQKKENQLFSVMLEYLDFLKFSDIPI